MPSNVAKGSRWKARSKQWLELQGRTVFHMELHRINYKSDGSMVPTKRDQLGADLGYLDTGVVVFVQVKGGLAPRSALVSAARAGFSNYRWPRFCRREVHIWRPFASEPEVVVCR